MADAPKKDVPAAAAGGTKRKAAAPAAPNIADALLTMCGTLESFIKEIKPQIKQLSKTMNKQALLSVQQQEAPKGKRQKKEKDPNKPKRAKSAYQVYVGQRFSELKSERVEGEKADAKMIMKDLAKEWSVMSDQMKARLVKEAGAASGAAPKPAAAPAQNVDDEDRKEKKKKVSCCSPWSAVVCNSLLFSFS